VATYFRRIAPFMLLAATAAQAQTFEDLNALEQQVTASLGAGIGEPGGPARPIDRRLKLSPCPKPAIVDPPALGAVAVRCQDLGWRIRVPLTAGSTSAAGFQQAAAVKAEPIVRRGDQIELVADTGTFSVSTVAVAEQDGAVGDHIRVRPASKPGTVIGIVTEDGRVALAGFR
jgi:flagella basal body P-ring formation protein FlgA